MMHFWILGATFAFAAAVQPGPFQAFLISRTMTRGWAGTWPSAFAPLLSDGPIIVLVLLVLSALPPALAPALQVAGGLFLLLLALGAWRSWRAGPQAEPDPSAGGRTLLQATVVNFLNPNPYLSWSLVMGPLLKESWAQSPSHGIALLVGFYGTFILLLLAFIALFHGARSLGPRVARTALLISVVALTAFGLYQLTSGLGALVG